MLQLLTPTFEDLSRRMAHVTSLSHVQPALIIPRSRDMADRIRTFWLRDCPSGFNLAGSEV